METKKDIKSVNEWLVDKRFNILNVFGNQGLFEDFISGVQADALRWAAGVSESCRGDFGGVVAAKKINDKIEVIARNNIIAKDRRGEISNF